MKKGPETLIIYDELILKEMPSSLKYNFHTVVNMEVNGNVYEELYYTEKSNSKK